MDINSTIFSLYETMSKNYFLLQKENFSLKKENAKLLEKIGILKSKKRFTGYTDSYGQRIYEFDVIYFNMGKAWSKGIENCKPMYKENIKARVVWSNEGKDFLLIFETMIHPMFMREFVRYNVSFYKIKK